VVKNQTILLFTYLYSNPQDKVTHNNVSSQVSLHDTISNKSMVREFYEETVERKRRAQHSIVTKDYCMAKKNYQEFKRQTSMNDGPCMFKSSYNLLFFRANNKNE